MKIEPSQEETMYVCICKAVTEEQIRCCVQNGVRSVKELRLLMGVGSECGSCVNCARQVIEQTLGTGAARGEQSYTFQSALRAELA
ncbi:MAG: (2Fe-2S)-binding protein [Burkholderiales bacterium]